MRVRTTRTAMAAGRLVRRRSVEATGGRCYLPGMADAAFDTLAVTRQLKAKGFDADQAEAITEAVRVGVTGGVATKADVAEVRGAIAELRTEQRWMKVVGAGIVAALVWLGVQIYDTNARLTGIEQALTRIEAALDKIGAPSLRAEDR